MTRADERGEGKIQFILITVFLIAAIIIAFRTVPVFVKGYGLQDFIRGQAKFQRARPKSPDEIISEILKKNQELKLPFERSDIKVVTGGVGVSSNVDIKISYSVTMNLFVYQWTKEWNLHEDTESAFAH